MRGANKLLLMISFLSLSLMAKANHGKDGTTEPVLLGCVSDGSTKKPVKGVTISIKSAKGEKEFTTDATGNFKIPQLPSGEVTIILEKKGYKTYRRQGVMVKEGMTIKLNFDMFTEEQIEENDVFYPLIRMMEGR